MILKAVWKWYHNCLSLHPVKTQVISSAVLWGVGDIAAQYITYHAAAKTKISLQLSEEDTKFMINWRRVAVTSMFGAGFVGPVGHFWYEGLDKFIRLKLHLMPKSARAIATKVATDGMIFGPVHLFVFFSYMGLCSGKTIPQVKEDLKKNFVPALLLEGGVWPFVQVFNFRYIPVQYQLLYVNLFCLLDSAFLSCWINRRVHLGNNGLNHFILPRKKEITLDEEINVFHISIFLCRISIYSPYSIAQLNCWI